MNTRCFSFVSQQRINQQSEWSENNLSNSAIHVFKLLNLHPVVTHYYLCPIQQSMYS